MHHWSEVLNNTLSVNTLPQFSLPCKSELHVTVKEQQESISLMSPAAMKYSEHSPVTLPLLAFLTFSCFQLLIYAICTLNNCVCSVVHMARVHANPQQVMMAVFLEACLPHGILDA